MMKPKTQTSSMNDIPWGLPQISRILDSGSLVRPAMMLDMMDVVAVSEWDEKELVTKGEKVRTTTSSMEVMK